MSYFALATLCLLFRSGPRLYEVGMLFSYFLKSAINLSFFSYCLTIIGVIPHWKSGANLGSSAAYRRIPSTVRSICRWNHAIPSSQEGRAASPMRKSRQSICRICISFFASLTYFPCAKRIDLLWRDILGAGSHCLLDLITTLGEGPPLC